MNSQKPMTKTEIIASLAETTDLSKQQVTALLDGLAGLISTNLGDQGPGVFTIPGLVKIERKKVPARPAEKNWRNPFTGELQDRPAKPASTKVKVRALKNLKDMV